ncbi:helix-turn-helix transcriptional regulator [Heyndrickxia camelliae]|nr:helix-turn-helix transcriptional regulator [Heyndrickxia camelliae]
MNDIVKCRLREIRLNHGLSLRDLETKSEISRGHLSNYENNKVQMSINTAVRLAKLLNCTLDEMFDY